MGRQRIKQAAEQYNKQLQRVYQRALIDVEREEAFSQTETGKRRARLAEQNDERLKQLRRKFADDEI